MSAAPSRVAYLTPESSDGTVTRVLSRDDGGLRVEVVCAISAAFRAAVAGDLGRVIFASRSRLARLGVEVSPDAPLELRDDHVRLEARVTAVVREYDLADRLPELIVPGLKVGRLVYCPESAAMSSEEVKAALADRLVQLPQGFSLGPDGTLTIRPHRVTYGLQRPLDTDDLMSILFREDGRALLSMLQVPRPTDTLEVAPRDGLITSCPMFLHRHYLVIENRDANPARHLQAVALDPVHTRGTRIFLEFHNPTDHVVLNPWVTARLYRAPQVPLAEWPVVAPQPPRGPFEVLRDALDRVEAAVGDEVSAYFRRAVGVADRMDRDPSLASLDVIRPQAEPPQERLYNYTARGHEAQSVLQADRFATSQLAELPVDAGRCLLLSYFPNFVEHVHICAAALQRRVSQIVFRRASFEHGMFLSARDHGRLADYAALGVDVYWADETHGGLLRHVFTRGRRGFFVDEANEARLRSALLFAFYGSARPLPPSEAAKVEELIGGLHELFGPNMGILTGGGPGAMQQATEAARRLGLLTGASYIETADQGTIKNVDFFQTFQDRSRHYRQRWFDVCSFQIFNIGGVGTLEEIGQTFTDAKLGIIERGPLVFFGSSDGGPYWADQVAMLRRMAREGRAPGWIHDSVLLSDRPADVVRFYRSVLDLA
ncbi:MAG TPA: LOG family protein [Myxococcota bacterium]|nr:LOG family protein [Myxococcota bacterium]